MSILVLSCCSPAREVGKEREEGGGEIRRKKEIWRMKEKEKRDGVKIELVMIYEVFDSMQCKNICSIR